ncbi:hypothetical protein [Streptomyces sp. LaBMicrA B280]
MRDPHAALDRVERGLGQPAAVTLGSIGPPPPRGPLVQGLTRH